MPTYEDAYPPIPSSQWVEISRETERENAGIEWLITRIFNQSSEEVAFITNSDNKSKCAKPSSSVRLTSFRCHRSAAISKTRSASSGSSVNGSLAYGVAPHGLVPLDTPENRKIFGDAVMPHTGFHAKRPPGADEAAKNCASTRVS